MIQKKVESIFAKIKAENLIELIENITQFKRYKKKIQVEYIFKILFRHFMVKL